MIIGIDPGKSGAVALLDDNGRLIEVADMPVVGPIISAALLSEIVHNWIDPLDPTNTGTAVIEDVHAMPKQGVSSSFSFGRALGVAEGVLAGEGFALRYVSPARWKKAMGLTADKGVSRRRAIELWPAHARDFARVKDDGRAEAALIARWHWLDMRVERAA
jgi:crossover junction endodeoxyribonuclease RuvC